MNLQNLFSGKIQEITGIFQEVSEQIRQSQKLFQKEISENVQEVTGTLQKDNKQIQGVDGEELWKSLKWDPARSTSIDEMKCSADI